MGFNDWSELLDSLLDKARREGWLDSLNNCKGDQDKIVEKIQDAPGVRRKLASWISHCSESKYNKSGGSATKLRDEGNAKFKREDYKGSLKLYSESVICSPEYGPELSLAFGNRSATLYHLGRYQECLKDVELALKYRFPKDKEYKLHQRKGLCYLKLHKFEEANLAFESAIKALPGANEKKFPAKRRNVVLKDIHAQIEEATLLMERTKITANSKEDFLSPKEFTESENLKGASASVELFESTSGRGIRATRDIEIGEVVFDEVPFASILLSENYSTHCHHCVTRIDIPIPCLKCTQARYCSEICRKRSWSQYHCHECGNLELLNSVGLAYLAVRIVLVAGIDKILSQKSKLSPVSSTDPYSRVLNLVEHRKGLKIEDNFQYAVTAILLAMMLEQRTHFLPSNYGQTSEIWLFVATLVHRHIGQLICNASAIFEVSSENDSKASSGVYVMSQNRIASAIYPSYSMMNHSCNPDVINSFVDNRIVVRVIQPIQRGAEVLNCYGPHYRRHRRQERQDQLQGQYNFECSCQTCSDKKYDDFIARFTDSIKCKFCDGPVAMPDRQANPHSLPCLDCGMVQEYSEQIQLIFQANDYLSQAESLCDAMDYQKAILLLRKCYQYRKMALYAHNENVAEIEDKLAYCYSMLGDYESSLKYLERSLQTVRERYGNDSIEIAHELMKYADVIEASQVVESKQDLLVQVWKEAQSIYQVHYGSHHPTFLSLSSKIKNMTI